MPLSCSYTTPLNHNSHNSFESPLEFHLNYFSLPQHSYPKHSFHNFTGEALCRAMTSNATASRAPANSSGSKVRRNLFHHQLSRRPTSTSTTTSATTLHEPLLDSSSDIVMRDNNGDPMVQTPFCHHWKTIPAKKTRLLRGKVRDRISVTARLQAKAPKTEMEARLLEMYKDRSIQPSEPAGE